jgi:pimeloyl-ACP methyl ester carboxylesterase
MPALDVHGARLAYDTGGDPSHPAVVFIHAGVATRAMWDPQFDDLATDHFVVRYDTRGYGESPGADEEFADRHDVFAVLDAVGLERARSSALHAAAGSRSTRSWTYPTA